LVQSAGGGRVGDRLLGGKGEGIIKWNKDSPAKRISPKKKTGGEVNPARGLYPLGKGGNE